MSEANKILLSTPSRVLWKFTIVCAFPAKSGLIPRSRPAEKCNPLAAPKNNLRTELVTSGQSAASGDRRASALRKAGGSQLITRNSWPIARNSMLPDSAILKKIQRQPRQTAGYKQLVRELGLRGDERRELNDRLQKLVASGQLIADNSDHYAIPQAPSGKNLVAGKLSLHRDGFGFVIPDLTSAAPALKARLSGDIFIPPHAVGAAMHGDLVLAEVTNFRTDGRTEGRLVRSLHRANPTVVGVFHYGGRHNYVTPIDSKISQEIVIPKGMETPSLVVRRSS